MISPNDYRVLVVDDEDGLRFVLREVLEREGFRVDEASDGEQAVEMAQGHSYDLYLLDMKMPKMNGLEALRAIRKLQPEALAVMITAFGSQKMAFDALKAGAYDYFTKPFNIDELRLILMRALEKQCLLRKLRQLEQQLGEAGRFGKMIGQSEPMRQIFALIERVAEHDVTVLITGESGTGKELVARAIHERSARREGPCVAVNCAAIPETLLESELFGHERGAFTGAISAHPGRFESADGGTIFLDEIGEMPLALQSKLLRVLQEHQVERIGSNKPRPVNIRVLVATNRDLAEMVRAGQFREDLYFRINVVPVHLPPLRERKDDLAALVHHFISEYNGRLGKRIEGVSPEAMALLEAHDWPGNIRELENTLQRAMVMAMGQMIDAAALPSDLKGGGNRSAQDRQRPSQSEGPFDLSQPLARHVEQIVEREERRIIELALERTDGHRQETADLLGISRKSLHNKMEKYSMFESGEPGVNS